MNNCKGIFGRLFGHDFKAIYDMKDFMPNGLKSSWNAMMMEATYLEALNLCRTNEKKYIKSVCSRCGKAIKEA